jgi:hypothetical protein
MDVRIYKPSKNAMQSGRAKAEGYWMLEYETETPRKPDPLMGWNSCGDTLNQVRLYFSSAEEAVAFAQKKGWGYSVQIPHERRVRPRNYVDNFKYVPHGKADKA